MVCILVVGQRHSRVCYPGDAERHSGYVAFYVLFNKRALTCGIRITGRAASCAGAPRPAYRRALHDRMIDSMYRDGDPGVPSTAPAR